MPLAPPAGLHGVCFWMRERLNLSVPFNLFQFALSPETPAPMPYDPKKHHRRSIRLKGYDYTQPGAYFITICTQNRECLFGEVVDGRMVLNELGQVARECWLAIPDHFPHSRLDEFVIMPNHVHGIIWIVGPDGKKELPAVGWNRIPVGAKDLLPPRGNPSPRPKGTSRTIGSMVRGFKIGVTKWARQHTDIYQVWQRNYYEHIIRNMEALRRIRWYIRMNPRRWAGDHP